MEGVGCGGGGGGGKQALCDTLIPPPQKKCLLKLLVWNLREGRHFFCFEVVRVENGRGGASPSLPPPPLFTPLSG